MTREEIGLLLGKASAAYPSKAPDFQSNPQIFNEWLEALADVDPQKAFSNYAKHRASSKWFPDIADIINHDPNQLTLEAQNQREHEIAIEEAFREWVIAGNEPERFVYKP